MVRNGHPVTRTPEAGGDCLLYRAVAVLEDYCASKNRRAVETGALGRPRARLTPRLREEAPCPTRQASIRRAWGECREGNTFSRARPPKTVSLLD